MEHANSKAMPQSGEPTPRAAARIQNHRKAVIKSAFAHVEFDTLRRNGVPS